MESSPQTSPTLTLSLIHISKKALASKGDHYEVLVDNVTAKENVTRFAKNAGYTVSVSQEEDVYRLSLTK